MHKLKPGENVMFKISGYEVVDIRNLNPPKTAHGFVNGPVRDGYVPVWVERENREATTIMVALDNLV